MPRLRLPAPILTAAACLIAAAGAASCLAAAAAAAPPHGAGGRSPAGPSTRSAPSTPPAPVASSAETDAIAALVGTTPPEWQAQGWLNSPPLRLADLRGKVVLVRWWTAGCPYCSTTAPALREIHRDFAARGLVVVGMYHHKEDGPYDPSVMRKTAKEYGFTFPIAFDPDWRTLKAWMRGSDSGWTSVTFLLDRNGVVRWFHPGGAYAPGDPAYAELRRTVTALLSER